MKKNNTAKHLPKTEYLHRLITVLLCLSLVLSVFSVINIPVIQASATTYAETRQEIKARLMDMIKNDGWDPYSADMSIDEFYALMELFEEGTLPLKSGAAPVFRAPGFDAPGIEEPSPMADEVYIPRTMFMFGGLTTNATGSPPPLEYNNTTGATDDLVNYPANLDPYNMGYLRPPTSWQGVKVNEESQAVVIVKDINQNKPQIAGDVDQDLFLPYDGHYVRRVTAQNTEATILGAIKLAGQDEYVYYYLTSDMQSSDVSTTTLPKGQKFIVEYLPIEHEIKYEVRMDSLTGTDITTDRDEVNINGNDVYDTWENIIFGTDHPSKTDAAAYSFTAWAPYGYTVEIYYDDIETPQLGKKDKGDYTSVNGGWALGMHPDYSIQNRFTLFPDTDKGPQALTISGTFYDNNVLHNRKVIAVVTETGAPIFDAASIIKDSEGTSNRGTSAYNKVMTTDGELVPYDYEDVYQWAKGLPSTYEYDEKDPTITDAGKENISKGNIATGDKWGWQGKQPQDGITLSTMELQEDGTYSFQWTFQTNSGEIYILDALQINGVSIRVPFLPKDAINSFVDDAASGVGLKSWYTEGTLPDGAAIRVELLRGFGEQRVYRIIVTGARSNVTVTGMNLMQSRSGAAEFVVYDLDGVTGATERNNTNHAEAIRYYSVGNGWGDLNSVDDNVFESNLIVHQDPDTLNWNGDPDLHGANIRFKLSDGYDSPYFLWENARGGTVINDQSSINRNPDGTVDYDSMKPVLTFDGLGDGEMMDSQHIYTDGSGWYYIRVFTQEPHKIALLTIIARPVRYVARYIPSYDSVAANDPVRETREGSLVGIVDEPHNMPEFTHDDEHESFLWETENGINAREYDTADGAYYDTAVDDIIRLPSNIPTDPGGSEGARYRFVDWVLVDDKYNPVWAWTNNAGHSVQVTTDKYGNRILVTPSTANDAVHHPALLKDDGTLEVGYDYEIYWTGSYYDLKSLTTGVDSVLDTWVTLTRDGKLAYAKNGEPVDMPEDTNWIELLADWGVRDANGDAAVINDTSEFHYRSNHITLADINQYAIPNENLGGNETDIYVLRLMPVWEPIENPFHYRVALNWVDSLGNVYQEYFEDYWQEVLTDWTLQSGYLTVQVIKNAGPFLDWIAQHPTYTFWDAVNNNNALYQYAIEHDNKVDEDGRKALREEMAKAVDEYLPALAAGNRERDQQLMDQYEKVLDALCTRDISGKYQDGSSVTDNKGNGTDDFWRLGNYAYQMHEDEGTIVVWMYEDKGGLAFRKEVKDEPFIHDDEFYFTVNEVLVGENNLPLEGTYKAYPEQCYNDDGTPRATLNKDAWLVEFDDGKVKNIVKNEGSPWPEPAVTYFTLKDGEGIMLYVPAGTYSITELGSKSGGAYRVKVQYDGDGTPNLNSSWSLPDGNLWLKGQDTVYHDPDDPSDPNPDGVSQVSATVYFEVGENNMIHTLQFNNMTASLSIEKALDATEENQQEFAAWLAESNNSSRKYHFTVQLELPAEYTPLIGQDTDDEGNPIGAPYYYFSMNVYLKDGSFVEKRELKLSRAETENNTWTGEIDLMGGQRAALVMTAPDDEQPLYYEYTESESGESRVVVITDRNDIVDVSGVPRYQNPDINNGEDCSIFYYDSNNQPVYVSSWDQIQYVTRIKGAPYLIHKNGDSLHYLVGFREDGSFEFRELPASPSDVNLHLAMVDDIYPDYHLQVCEKKDVPLYSLDGNEYNLITSMSDLKDLSEADNVYYRYEDEYYHVVLNPILDRENNPSFEGVYPGLYGDEIAMTLQKEFGVYSSRNGAYSPVESLDEIRVQVDTEELPVSKAIFNYQFEEVWRKAEWKTNEWDDANQKTRLFVEEWINQSGVAEIGKQANAKVTNWYGEPPEDCYLAITEEGGKPGETFLYKITNTETDEELIVSVTIGEDGKGETIVQCPPGNYTVEEITDWAWRYEDGECEQDMPINVNSSHTLTSPAPADFTNERNKKVWLGGENRENNVFDFSSSEENENVSSAYSWFMDIIDSIVQIFR